MNHISNLLQRTAGRFPVGIWITLVALSGLMLAWAGQAYSLFDWEGAVDFGLQNERFGTDPVERTWAKESLAVAVTDMLWPMPITVAALVGIIRSRSYGVLAGIIALAIGVYFPLVFAFQRWDTFRETAILALVVFTVPCLMGIAGLWVNRGRLYRAR